MQWFLLGVMVVALLSLSTFYPKTAFSTLGVLSVVAAIIVFTSKDDAVLSRQQLPVSDILIENAVIVAAYGSSYQFHARLVNVNPTILAKESVLSLTMLDCTSDADDDCTVLGQTDERFIIKIPPGQARDISTNLFFRGAQPSGTIRWQYKVIETRS